MTERVVGSHPDYQQTVTKTDFEIVNIDLSVFTS